MYLLDLFVNQMKL